MTVVEAKGEEALLNEHQALNRSVVPCHLEVLHLI